MFYVASEIVFWILLAALIGVGIGYGINEAKSVRLGKRLNDSGADAPLERELAVACLPGNLMDFLECDVSELDIGDSIHVRDLQLPEDIRSLDDDHLTIAIVAAPTVAEVERRITPRASRRIPLLTPCLMTLCAPHRLTS